LTGSDRSINVSRIEKMAVFAPMPSASDKTATSVTMGVALNVRNALFRSFIVSFQFPVSRSRTRVALTC